MLSLTRKPIPFKGRFSPFFLAFFKNPLKKVSVVKIDEWTQNSRIPRDSEICICKRKFIKKNGLKINFLAFVLIKKNIRKTGRRKKESQK